MSSRVCGRKIATFAHSHLFKNIVNVKKKKKKKVSKLGRIHVMTLFVSRWKSELPTHFLPLTKPLETMETLFFKRAKRTFKTNVIPYLLGYSYIFLCA